MGNTWTYHRNPDVHPYDESPCEWDDNFGFPEGARKKKEIRFTDDELESISVPPHLRNYCAHKIIKYKACEYENIIMHSRCHHLWHEYLNCMNEETKDQMKAYERERRLLLRRKRIMDKQAEMKGIETRETAAA